MAYKIITVLALTLSFGWLISDPGFEPLIAILISLAAYLRDEVYGFIGSNFLTLTPKSSIIKNLTNSKFSFINSEFINPKIVEDLEGWISDTGDQIVSINISDSNSSNRYFGEISIEETTKYPIVKNKNDSAYFAYQYVGCSLSGIHIVQTWDSGGGSGIFCGIIFLILSNDKTLSFEEKSLIKKDRYIIKKIGAVPLGDRYNGQIRYRYGLLSIAPDKNTLFDKQKRIFIF